MLALSSELQLLIIAHLPPLDIYHLEQVRDAFEAGSVDRERPKVCRRVKNSATWSNNFLGRSGKSASSDNAFEMGCFGRPTKTFLNQRNSKGRRHRHCGSSRHTRERPAPYTLPSLSRRISSESIRIMLISPIFTWCKAVVSCLLWARSNFLCGTCSKPRKIRELPCC